MFRLGKHFAVIVALGAMSFASFANADDERPDATEALTLVQAATEAGISILKEYPDDNPLRRRRFQAAAQDRFALEIIGQLALGGHRREISAEQMARFQPLFETFLARKYSSLLGTYSGEQLQIQDVRESGKRDLQVMSTVETGGSVYRIAWRVRQVEGLARIIDVQVEDISLMIALRDELDSVIRREGIDGLIEKLGEFADDLELRQASVSAAG